MVAVAWAVLATQGVATWGRSAGMSDRWSTSPFGGVQRNVPESEKRQVYAEYRIRSHSSGQYEVDHLIPLELGRAEREAVKA
jgi:hypothetical protein